MSCHDLPNNHAPTLAGNTIASSPEAAPTVPRTTVTHEGSLADSTGPVGEQPGQFGDGDHPPRH